MPVRYGATAENLNLIHEKARTKADGVYSFRGLKYRVENGVFTHYADYETGCIMERVGNFSVTLGPYAAGAARQVLQAL